MKLLFLAFRYVAAGGGVCCAPHHSLFPILSLGSMQGVPLNDATTRSTHHLVPVMRRAFCSLCTTDLDGSQTPSVIRLVHHGQHHAGRRHHVLRLEIENELFVEAGTTRVVLSVRSSTA